MGHQFRSPGVGRVTDPAVQACRAIVRRIMWAGVEPEPQKYNMTYLTIVEHIVELLEAHEIVVLLDMHQDVLSTRTGSYDGIPAWLYDRFPPSPHACE